MKGFKGTDNVFWSLPDQFDSREGAVPRFLFFSVLSLSYVAPRYATSLPMVLGDLKPGTLSAELKEALDILFFLSLFAEDVEMFWHFALNIQHACLVVMSLHIIQICESTDILQATWV